MVKPHRIHAGVLLGPSPLRLRACQSGRRDTNLNVAATYCDHIICLAAGVVVSAGPVEEVYTSDNLSWIYGWPIHVMTTDGGERSAGPTPRHRQCRKPARPHFRKDNPMKYCVMSVALPVSLALCPQPVFVAEAGNGGEAALSGWSRRQPVERLPRTQPLPALQAKDVRTTFLPLPLSRAPSWWWARSVLISRNSRQGGSLAAWPGRGCW